MRWFISIKTTSSSKFDSHSENNFVTFKCLWLISSYIAWCKKNIKNFSIQNFNLFCSSPYTASLQLASEGRVCWWVGGPCRFVWLFGIAHFPFRLVCSLFFYLFHYYKDISSLLYNIHARCKDSSILQLHTLQLTFFPLPCYKNVKDFTVWNASCIDTEFNSWLNFPWIIDGSPLEMTIINLFSFLQFHQRCFGLSGIWRHYVVEYCG